MEERTSHRERRLQELLLDRRAVGWALFPTVEEAELFKNLNINYFSCIPAYNQEGARLDWNPPVRRPAIRAMVDAFQERRDVVVRGLTAIPGHPLPEPQGGLLPLPERRGGMREAGHHRCVRPDARGAAAEDHPSTLLQMFLLFEYRVATMDRKSFGRIGTENMHYLRISIATDMDSLKEAVRRIGEAARDQAGFARFLAKGENLF